MKGKTHIVIGLTLTVGAGILLEFNLVEYAIAAIYSVSGSLLPDIDHPGSLAGQLCPFLSIPINRKFGHRSITHSLVSLLVFTIVTICIGTLDAAIGLFCGYLGHIIADMLTPSGVALFYPLTKKRISIGNIKTGSDGEQGVAVALFLIVLWMAFK